MMKIIIASLNPIKINAVSHGFAQLFPDESWEINQVNVDSGVADQPLSDQDTKYGAVNRAENARQIMPNGDYWVGLESGCDYLDGEMVTFAWVVVLSRDNMGSARTAQFRLPKEVQRLVETGIELGDANDIIFGEHNSKQKSGAVGLLTNNVIIRKDLYEQAVILALIPFLKPSLYR